MIFLNSRYRWAGLRHPNVISANGNGLNDYLELFGSKDILQAKLKIFDRWGELIFSSNNLSVKFKNPWDGTYKIKETYDSRRLCLFDKD